jgi:hypothetical protein
LLLTRWCALDEGNEAVRSNGWGALDIRTDFKQTILTSI